MRILLASPLLEPGDVAANLRQLELILTRYQPECPDLCLLPEASLLGGCWRPGEAAWLRHAESVPNGSCCQQAVELARRFQTHLLIGLIELDRERHYLTHCLCGPQGVVGWQRKLFPANPARPSRLSPGGQLTALEVAGQRLVVLACADWLLPEPVLLAGRLQPSLIVCPTDCFHVSQASLALAKQQARAADVGAHVVALFGRDQELSGQVLNAIVCSPRGEVLLADSGPAGVPYHRLLDLELRPPQTVWGGFAARWQQIGRALINPGTEAGVPASGREE